LARKLPDSRIRSAGCARDVGMKALKQVSLKGEYRYLFADGDQIDLLPGVTLGPFTANDFVSAELSPDIQSVRLSLDYRFNFAGQ